MSVCPCGGHHDFQTVKDNDFWAGLGAGARTRAACFTPCFRLCTRADALASLPLPWRAGACGTCLFCVWWPLLLWCVPSHTTFFRAHPQNHHSCGATQLTDHPVRVLTHCTHTCCLSSTLCHSAPLCYFGGREISKDLSDRVCTKCLVRVDRQGSIKEQPLNVPEVNPVTGQLNTVYGWVQPGKGVAQQAAWVPQPREGGGEGDTSKTD